MQAGISCHCVPRIQLCSFSLIFLVAQCHRFNGKGRKMAQLSLSSSLEMVNTYLCFVCPFPLPLAERVSKNRSRGPLFTLENTANPCIHVGPTLTSGLQALDARKMVLAALSWLPKLRRQQGAQKYRRDDHAQHQAVVNCYRIIR